jgi:hypothetical protein
VLALEEEDDKEDDEEDDEEEAEGLDRDLRWWDDCKRWAWLLLLWSLDDEKVGSDIAIDYEKEQSTEAKK